MTMNSQGQRLSALVSALGVAALVSALVIFSRSAAFDWKRSTPAEQGMDAAKLKSMEEALAQRRTKALLVIRHDSIVWEWYAPGHGPEKKHYTASLAKSLVGGMSLILAMNDGRMRADNPAYLYIPAWKDDPVRRKITIRQLATHSSGIEDASAPETGQSHNDLEGWKGDFWRGRSLGSGRVEAERNPFSIALLEAPVIFEPGTDFAYSNPGMGALSYAVTATLRGTEHEDIRSLLRERVMRPIGVDDGEWSIGYDRTYMVDGLPVVANWGGGNFTARATARVGRLMLHKGEWEGKQLIARRWVELAVAYGGTPLMNRPPSNPIPAPALGWYNNSDGVWNDVPRDAFCGGGAGNQHLLVVPSLDLIVVRYGETIGDEAKGESFWGGALKYLFEPVVAAVMDRQVAAPATGGLEGAPYPPSELITGIEWAPKEMIRRGAKGSDNWPITWVDDGDLYTAYGDGWGFEPRTEEKLSMGFARVEGPAKSYKGVNIRSASGETIGDGAAGGKASGILMVDGVLYLLVRNQRNSRLSWSADHGRTWTPADWRWEKSFGAPTFLNFGKNYAGARDGYVYVYSHDHDSAYEPADRMVLARVPADRVRERDAYEFFAGRDDAGQPRWSDRIEERAAVFENEGRCYRSGITYNAGLKRYLWAQILPGSRDSRGPRFEGGFGVYEAPEPWGPWRTVYFTEHWDVGPGETASFPAKWMSADGRTVHLVFSGDDQFSVRRARLIVGGE